MKRQLIITVIATVLVLTLGIVCETASYRISTAYRQRLLTVGAALGRGNWQDALQRTLEISEQWEKQCGIVQLWINHGDTDQVTQGLLQLRAAILYQDELEALEAFDACMENFGHLHHRDAFTLKNIL